MWPMAAFIAGVALLQWLGLRTGWLGPGSAAGLSIAGGALGMLAVRARCVARNAYNHSFARDALQREVEAHQLAVAALAESEAQLHAAVSTAVDAIIVIDEHGLVQRFNGAAERLFGYSFAEIRGKNISLVMPAPYRQEHDGYLAHYLATGQARVIGIGREVTAMHRDGTTFPAELAVSEMYINGRRQFTGIVRDISERKKSEESVRHLNAELQQQLSRLAQVNRSLAEKNQENEMFVYSVSHDLRSPLVNLQGFSQELSTSAAQLRGLLAEGSLPADVGQQVSQVLEVGIAEPLRFILSSVTRLSSIIDALLKFSRVGRVEFVYRPLPMSAVAARVVESLAAICFDRGATINVLPLPAAFGDETAVEQVLANLLQNALFYLDPQRPGAIEIGCARGLPQSKPGFVVYYVRDNGLGIPEHAQGKVFQLFKRFHGEQHKGEGIGLAIAQRIVERHHGTLWLESAISVGSTFYFMLPEYDFTSEGESTEHLHSQPRSESACATNLS